MPFFISKINLCTITFNVVDIEMSSRTLLQIIRKDEKAKQFWKKFLGKDILDELLKYPELLSMQDAKRAKGTKEEKEFFVKCIFSVSTENGFKFEREERISDV